MPPLKQDNQEDQLNPANKYHSEESRTPNALKTLQEAEQQSAYDRDFDEMTRPENYARDGKNAADEVKDKEINPYGYQHSGNNDGTTRRKGGKRTIKGTLKGALGGKKGPIAALITLLVGGGAAFSVFLVPGMGIIHFKEMLTDKLDDQIGAVNMRSNVLIRNKLNDSKAPGLCTSKVNIHCKFSTSSKRQVAKFEKAGFKIEADDMFGGRKRITKITFPDDGPSVSNPGELKRLLKEQPKLQAHVYRAYYPRAAALDNKFSKSVAKVFRKYGISKASVFSGTSKEDFNKQLRESTRGLETTNKINNAADPEDEDGGDERKSKADKATEELKSDKPISLADARAKIKTGVGVLGGVQSACGAYTIANLVQGGAKTYRVMQMVQFSQNLILNPADKIKAGDSTAAETEFIGNKITEPDMRKEIDNPEAEGKTANQAYGMSAMDSPIFKAFAYDDAATLPYRSAQFMSGGGMVGKLAGAMTQIESFLGGREAARKTCKVVNSPVVVAISFIGLFIPGVGLASAIAGTAASATISYLLMPLLIQQLTNFVSGQVLDENTANVDIGDAVASGASGLLGGVAQSRGMMPSNADQFNEYLAFTEGENNQMIAALKSEASETPFDISNQYSFMGMFARSITPSFLSARTSAIGAFQIVPSFLGSSLATLTTNASANAPIDPARFEKCTDRGYADIGLKADIACNPRYGLSPDELTMTNESLVQYMIDEGQIKEDDLSGAPVEGSDYADWVEGCVDRTAGYGDPMDDDGMKISLSDGRDCIDTTIEQYKYFRAFHFNNSLADDMELEEVPRDQGGSGDGSGNSSGENSGNIRDDGWAWPGPKGTTACGFDCYGGHFGLDVNTPDKSPVYAARDGEVVMAGADPYMTVAACPVGALNGTQQTIVLRHTVNGQPVDTYYTHLTAGSFSLKQGDKVKAGDQLALSGSTGCSTGPHLHFGIYKPNWPSPSNAVDPTTILGRSG